MNSANVALARVLCKRCSVSWLNHFNIVNEDYKFIFNMEKSTNYRANEEEREERQREGGAQQAGG